MWMSNTATAVMMLPLTLSMVRNLDSSPLLERRMLLGLAWAANLGGMATLIGTPPNIIVATFRNGRMDGKPTIHKNGYEAARANAQTLAKVLKSSATPDPRSEVMLMVAALKADLS